MQWPLQKILIVPYFTPSQIVLLQIPHTCKMGNFAKKDFLYTSVKICSHTPSAKTNTYTSEYMCTDSHSHTLAVNTLIRHPSLLSRLWWRWAGCVGRVHNRSGTGSDSSFPLSKVIILLFIPSISDSCCEQNRHNESLINHRVHIKYLEVWWKTPGSCQNEDYGVCRSNKAVNTQVMVTGGKCVCVCVFLRVCVYYRVCCDRSRCFKEV